MRPLLIALAIVALLVTLRIYWSDCYWRGAEQIEEWTACMLGP